MNQTTNYGLNQWVSADRIQMEDFNADNAKLESALTSLNEASRYVYLKTVTTTEDLTQVDIDLTDIDWTVYPQIIIMAKIQGVSGSGGRVLFNGCTEKYYRHYNSLGNAEDAFCAGNFYMDSSTSRYFNRLTITGSTSIPQCDIEIGGASQHTSYYFTGPTGTGAALNTLNFTTNSGSIAAGTAFVIYGVKF